MEIYFDCSATIKPYPEVLKTFEAITVNDFANSSSNHGLGYKSLTVLEKARRQVAKYLNVQPEEIIFTSGATEGNNLAIKGVCYREKKHKKIIITTKGEHPSVLEVFHKLEEDGFKAIYLDYDKEGKINMEQLKQALNDDVALVSIMAINNEVGYIFPIDKIYQIIKERSDAYLHVDATQAIGKEILPSNSYDLLTFSGHKIGGLKGSGVLVKKKDVYLEPLINGGGQENGLRSGTSSLGLDCALATALRITMSTFKERYAKADEINKYLRAELSSISEIVITSPRTATPFILNFALTEHKGSVIAEALSNNNIYVSTTSACSSRQAGESYVLKSAGFDSTIYKNSIRLSFSGLESLEEAQFFVDTLKKLLKEIRPNVN